MGKGECLYWEVTTNCREENNQIDKEVVAVSKMHHLILHPQIAQMTQIIPSYYTR